MKHKQILFRALREVLNQPDPSEHKMREAMSAALQPFLFEKKERHPMILSMIMTPGRPLTKKTRPNLNGSGRVFYFSSYLTSLGLRLFFFRNWARRINRYCLLPQLFKTTLENLAILEAYIKKTVLKTI